MTTPRVLLRHAGFTLVEVLVALVIMAVLAGLAWRGMDGMMRARDGTQQAVERAARLNTILAQWQQDLAALHDSGVVPTLSFDGQSLRLTRLHGPGVMLVVWSLKGSRWQRWTSADIDGTAALQDAWLRSQQLLGNEPGQLALLDEVSDFQVYYFRGNAWTNAQSTGDLAETRPTAAAAAPPASAPSAPAGAASAAETGAARELLPDGVRLVLGLPAGPLTRDIALGPRPR